MLTRGAQTYRDEKSHRPVSRALRSPCSSSLPVGSSWWSRRGMSTATPAAPGTTATTAETLSTPSNSFLHRETYVSFLFARTHPALSVSSMETVWRRYNFFSALQFRVNLTSVPGFNAPKWGGKKQNTCVWTQLSGGCTEMWEDVLSVFIRRRTWNNLFSLSSPSSVFCLSFFCFFRRW